LDVAVRAWRAARFENADVRLRDADGGILRNQGWRRLT